MPDELSLWSPTTNYTIDQLGFLYCDIFVYLAGVPFKLSFSALPDKYPDNKSYTYTCDSVI